MALTLGRIPVAGVFVGTLLLVEPGVGRLVAAFVILSLIEVSDLLDGILARRLGVESRAGEILDPYADAATRFLVFVGLAASGHTLWLLPVVVSLRDLTVSYARIGLTIANESPAARMSGKIKATVQSMGSFLLLLFPILPFSESPTPRLVVTYIIILVTVWSAGSYVRAAVRAALRARSGD
jgi:CDP-diacylglycerol--glycerol-3-phosphate 3-phosphatidyltransferase